MNSHPELWLPHTVRPSSHKNMGSSSSLRSSEENYKLELGEDAETSMTLGTTAVAEPVVAK